MQANEMGAQNEESLTGELVSDNDILGEQMDSAVRWGKEKTGASKGGIIGVCNLMGDGGRRFLHRGEERKRIEGRTIGELDENGVCKVMKCVQEGVLGNQNHITSKGKEREILVKEQGCSEGAGIAVEGFGSG